MTDIVAQAGSSGPGIIFKKRISFNFTTVPVTGREVTGAFADAGAVADAGDLVQASPIDTAVGGGLGIASARVSATGVVAIGLNNSSGGTLTPNTVTLDVYVTRGTANA